MAGPYKNIVCMHYVRTDNGKHKIKCFAYGSRYVKMYLFCATLDERNEIW